MTLRETLLELFQRGDPHAATWRIARVTGYKTRQCYRELCRMESEGLVERSRHSTSNNVIWRTPRAPR